MTKRDMAWLGLYLQLIGLLSRLEGHLVWEIGMVIAIAGLGCTIYSMFGRMDP